MVTDNIATAATAHKPSLDIPRFDFSDKVCDE